MKMNGKAYKILYSAGTLNDLKEGRDWYNLQQKNPGKRFINDIKETINSVSRNPLSFSTKYPHIRTAICKVFPYAVHFELDETARVIRIVSIFHFSRRPFWLKD